MTPHTAPQGYPARILIVDDERHNRQLLEVMLAQEGFQLQLASGGEEALAMVAAEAPDLILLDVMMPGMDGYQVASRIKADPATQHVRIIMLTALDDSNSRKHGLSTGAEGYLAKPVNRAELTAGVRALLRLSPHGYRRDDGT
ncbi:N/A [soil metagenome]